MIFLLAIMPFPIRAWVLRRRGHEVARGARIGFGAIVSVGSITMGEDARIKPFAVVRANELSLGARSTIGSLTLVTASTIRLGSDSAIAPLTIITGDLDREDSQLTMGDHSKIFPLCWLEAGRGIHLGSRVGIGGHGLIFTHGSWANHFLGAPVGFGPVHIEDRVWLPWRVFVMPGVTIGENAILGAGSIVTRDVPANALAAGMPATVTRERAYKELDHAALQSRISSVIEGFRDQMRPSFEVVVVEPDLSRSDGAERLAPGAVLIGGYLEPDAVSRAVDEGNAVIDVCEELVWASSHHEQLNELEGWLNQYGVWLDHA